MLRLHVALIFFFPPCCEQLIKIVEAELEIIRASARLIVSLGCFRKFTLVVIEVDADDVLHRFTLNADILACLMSQRCLLRSSVCIGHLEKARVRVHILLSQLIQSLLILPEVQIVKLFGPLLLLHLRLQLSQIIVL